MVVFAAGCSTAPPPSGTILAPNPVPVQTPGVIGTLVTRLADDAFATRDAAAEELRNLGTRPESQAAVIDALRAAATAADPELRTRARSILEAIDRTEGMIPSGTFSYGLGRQQLRLELRYFADGSVELLTRVNDSPEELFSGRDLPELAGRVTRAARDRGYREEEFTMLPDGSFRMGGNTMKMGLEPEEHLVPEFAIWASRVQPTERTLPERARGAWRIEARMIDGRGFRAGLRVADLITEIDGRRPESFGEFRRLLGGATKLKVIRLDAVEVEIRL